MTRSVAIVFPRWWGEQRSRPRGRARGAHDPADAHAALLAFEKMVRTVTEVAPLVEVERLGCIVFASRGPSRYFGGDEALARRLHDSCSAAGAAAGFDGRCGVGVADSRFAAMAAAHLAAARGTPCVVASSVTTRFIDALPVNALEQLSGVGSDTVDLFVRLGLGTCGALRAVGEAALIDRFGLEGARAYRLIEGSDVVPLSPDAPPADFATAVDTESPLVDVRHVVHAVRPAVEAMVGDIAAHGRECVRVMLTCHTDHAETSRRIWGEPHGFSARAIVDRLACQIDGWLTGGPATGSGDGVHDDAFSGADLPTTGVVRIEVVPLECRDKLAVQPLLWGGHQENVERAARAVAMACAADPAVEVTVPQWTGGRDVAGTYARVPVAHVDLSDVEASERRVNHGNGAAVDWSGSIPRPSPAFVLSAPSDIEVLDARGHPVGVTGRHELTAVPSRVVIADRRYEVVRTAGPWPVEERWWDPLRRRRHVRMQMLVRNDRGDTRVLLVGLENRRWSLLARYD